MLKVQAPPLPCRPPRWAANGHLQTILGNYLPGEPCAHISHSFRIPLSDGDQLAGRYYPGETDVLVMIFHGLGGDDQAHYVRRTVTVARGMGHHVWTLNHRGCGAGRGLAARPYHSGSADDLGAVFATGRERHPGLRQLAVGFSLSANALLLNLGDGLGAILPKPDLALAVNPPIDLEHCAVLIKTGLNRLYDLRFVKRCRRAIHERVADRLIPDIYRTRPWMTLHDFDNAYTAPAIGLRDREEYYRRCSARDYLGKISIPTAILQSKDDPFIPWQHHAEAIRSPMVHLHLEDHGGHMGYLSRDLSGHRWLPFATEHYIRELLSV